MLKERIVKARCETDDRCPRFRNHLDGDRIERENFLDIEIRCLGVAYPLARATHRLKHCDERLSHAMGVEKLGDPGWRRTVPGERQDACAGLQVSNNALERTAMERNERNVLQRPAHPRRGETESGWLWQANELLGRDKRRELLADAEMKGIAARENRDRAPPVPLDLAERVAHGTGPRKAPAADKIARQLQMARTADDQLRRPDQPPGNGG